MENYDSVIGFDYTDSEEWKRWIKEELLPLYKQLSIITGLRERLEDELASLKEALNRESMRAILLGGVTEEGEYRPNSLAKLYREVLGVFINPKEWVAYCKTGVDPADRMECHFEETEFLKFASEIRDLVEMIARKMGLEIPDVSREKIEELLANPEKLADVLREAYRLMAGVTANCDYHTFFVLSLYCIPKFYVREAYPKLKEKLEKVMEILELEEKLVPETDDSRLRDDLTLIGHRKVGFADLVYRLNETFWRAFEGLNFAMELSKTLNAIGIQVDSLECLKNSYFKSVGNTLQINGWTEPSYIRINTHTTYTNGRYICGKYVHERGCKYTYHVKGPIITHYSWEYYPTHSSGESEYNVSLYQFFQDVSPALFLHYYKLILKNDGFQIVRGRDEITE